MFSVVGNKVSGLLKMRSRYYRIAIFAETTDLDWPEINGLLVNFH